MSKAKKTLLGLRGVFPAVRLPPCAGLFLCFLACFGAWQPAAAGHVTVYVPPYDGTDLQVQGRMVAGEASGMDIRGLRPEIPPEGVAAMLTDRDGNLLALASNFVAGADGVARGSLDCSTAEIGGIFAALDAEAVREFRLALWDSVGGRLVGTGTAEMRNNPVLPELYGGWAHVPSMASNEWRLAVAGLQAEIDANEEAIAALQGASFTNADGIVGLWAAVATNTAGIEALGGATGTNEEAIAVLRGLVETNAAGVSSNAEEIAALRDALTLASNAIPSIEGLASEAWVAEYVDGVASHVEAGISNNAAGITNLWAALELTSNAIPAVVDWSDRWASNDADHADFRLMAFSFFNAVYTNSVRIGTLQTNLQATSNVFPQVWAAIESNRTAASNAIYEVWQGIYASSNDKPSTSQFATRQWVADYVDNHPQDMSWYATEGWVEGYVATNIPEGIATEDWVEEYVANNASGAGGGTNDEAFATHLADTNNPHAVTIEQLDKDYALAEWLGTTYGLTLESGAGVSWLRGWGHYISPEENMWEFNTGENLRFISTNNTVDFMTATPPMWRGTNLATVADIESLSNVFTNLDAENYEAFYSNLLATAAAVAGFEETMSSFTNVAVVSNLLSDVAGLDDAVDELQQATATNTAAIEAIQGAVSNLNGEYDEMYEWVGQNAGDIAILYARTENNSDTNSVKKTGDTMTGRLTVPSLLIGGMPTNANCGMFVGANGYMEGTGVAVGGVWAHAEGNKSVATGAFAHAEGVLASALGEGSHAEGKDTVASGAYSHAEGQGSGHGGPSAYGTASHAEGFCTVAGGTASHAEGNCTFATGAESHAGGFASEALGNTSIALGIRARAIDAASYVWSSGVFDGEYGVSRGEGTYTIWPRNGIYDFYIGNSRKKSIETIPSYVANNSVATINDLNGPVRIRSGGNIWVTEDTSHGRNDIIISGVAVTGGVSYINVVDRNFVTAGDHVSVSTHLDADGVGYEVSADPGVYRLNGTQGYVSIRDANGALLATNGNSIYLPNYVSKTNGEWTIVQGTDWTGLEWGGERVFGAVVETRPDGRAVITGLEVAATNRLVLSFRGAATNVLEACSEPMATNQTWTTWDDCEWAYESEGVGTVTVLNADPDCWYRVSAAGDVEEGTRVSVVSYKPMYVGGTGETCRVATVGELDAVSKAGAAQRRSAGANAMPRTQYEDSLYPHPTSLSWQFDAQNGGYIRNLRVGGQVIEWEEVAGETTNTYSVTNRGTLNFNGVEIGSWTDLRDILGSGFPLEEDADFGNHAATNVAGIQLAGSTNLLAFGDGKLLYGGRRIDGVANLQAGHGITISDNTNTDAKVVAVNRNIDFDDVTVWGDLTVAGTEYHNTIIHQQTVVEDGVYTNHIYKDIYTTNYSWEVQTIVNVTRTTNYVDQVINIGGNQDYSLASSVLSPSYRIDNNDTNNPVLTGVGSWNLSGCNIDLGETMQTVEHAIPVFDGGTLEYPHTLDLSDGAEQAFVKGANGQTGTFALALPAADPAKVGHLTVYADMDPPAGFYFDLSATNIVSRSYPAEKPWLDAEAPSTWKFEFESILGSAGWYYLKTTEYITE